MTPSAYQKISISRWISVWVRTYFISLCKFIMISSSYNFGVLTGILVMPQFLLDMQISQNSQQHGSYLISTMTAAAFIGSLVSGPFADIIGRKGLTLLATTIFVFGDVLQVGADSIAMLYGGRVMTGISLGILSMVVPLYQSEISPKEMRGRLVSTVQLGIVSGIAVAYWVDYAALSLTGSMAWRLPFGLQLIPAILFFVGLLNAPESTYIIHNSPRYLVQRQQDRHALEVLSTIRGNGQKNHTDVLMEFTEIKQSITFEREHTSRDYWYLFKQGNDNNQRRLVLGIAVQMFQQLTGANAILMYAPKIFETTGIAGANATLFANGISGILNWVSAIPSLIVMDKWGRRPTLVVGSVVCSICLTVMAVVTGLHASDEPNVTSTSTGSLSGERNLTLLALDDTQHTVVFMVMMYLYVFVYGCSWGSAGWTYPTELYSQGVRAKALGITSAASWLASFAVIQISPLLMDRAQWRFYATYAIICACLAVITHKFLPETMGKSLEEVDLIFTCDFNSYDQAVHHPKTAAEALERLEQMHSKQSHLFSFGFNSTSNALVGSENSSTV
ncbi:general substrate transporter [Spinellus fusiger]|nr:general substrate transporter [Spinellus fusiger]